MNAGVIHVWKTAAPGHDALRKILSLFTEAPLDYATAGGGKPWLPAAPHLKFNLSHSHGAALIAVALDVEVGADIERYHAIPQYQDLAARFFPPHEPPPSDERDFLRRWVRIEAMLKALGIGLYGAGAAIDGEWTVREIEAGPEYAAAVAAPQPDLPVEIHECEL